MPVKNEHPISEYNAVKASVLSKGMIRMPGQERKAKHNTKGVRIDGFFFGSEKEGNYYIQLKLAQEAGIVSYFHRQVKFDLPGGITYACDFQEFYPDGRVRYVDVKGRRLPEYIRNKKMVEALYPVTIEEV